ncbi:MAG: NAD(P)H-hydrate dehydratase [Flavobacteriales bacterium]
MIPILNSQQRRAADAFTIKEKPIASIDLMEQAASACTDYILQLCERPGKIHIFCGNGNNGGDGLAISRHFIYLGFEVVCYLIESNTYVEDNLINQERLSQLLNRPNLQFSKIHTTHQIAETNERTIIVDALLGSGLNRSPEGFLKDLILHINTMTGIKVAIDVPSGLGAETVPDAKSTVFKADYTLSFQSPMLSFLMAEGYQFTGKWELLDIGLLTNGISLQASKYFYLEQADIKEMLRPRPKFSHKGTFGHALLIAGSEDKIGAALLASKAALRSGCGLLSVCTPEKGKQALNSYLPEAMISSNAANINYIAQLPDISAHNAIAAGPGLGQHPETHQVIKQLIQNSSVPLVLDADALNILSENPTWLSFLPSGCILTPHPGEFDRLAGKCADSMDRFEKAKTFAFKYQCYLIIKSAYSYLVCPDGSVFFNSTGNPSMAKGGSGDALTGMILGLLASGYSPMQAALIGIYAHGLAGDLALSKHSIESVLCGDLIEQIGISLSYIRRDRNINQ